MDNRISIYQGNTKTLACLVQGMSDVSTYTPYLSVKRKDTDASTLLFKAGYVSDPSGTFTFALTTTDTSMSALDYVYDITIVGNGNVITVVRDRFSIMANVYV